MLSVLEESCVSHDFPSYACTDEAVSYSADVNPIIRTKCAISGCHNGDNGDNRDWTNFSLFQSKNDVVKSRVVSRVMPPPNSPAGQLSQEEISTIACWADQGAKNN